MNQRTHGTGQKSTRNLGDIRSLTEALGRALHDSRLSTQTAAEQLGVGRAYLGNALNEEHDELQFQARLLVPFCRLVGTLPLEWMADQLGYVLVPREHAASAECVLRETLDVATTAGKLSERVRLATADGRICEVERADIIDAARRVQREAAEVERAVEGVTTAPGRRSA